MADLKLSTASPVDEPLAPVDGTVSPPKKGGCGCFAVGCAVVIMLVIGPIIGVGVWVSTMDDAAWGEQLIAITQMDFVASAFKNGIDANDTLSIEQKEAMLEIYYKFSTTYSNLPFEKKQKASENIFKLLKIVIFSPDQFKDAPPPELVELVEIFDPNFAAQLKRGPVTSTGTATSLATSTGTTVTPSPTPLPTPTPTPVPAPVPGPSPSTSTDPFSFDLPSPTPAPGPGPTPAPAPVPAPATNPFDF